MKKIYLVREDDYLATNIVAAFTSKEEAESAMEICEDTAKHNEIYNVIEVQLDPLYF